MKGIFRTIWRPSLVLLIAILFATGSLQNTHQFSIDAGVYMEIGSQIIDGAVPYRDFWDHKPPAIYAVNALGLWLFPESLGAMNIFEMLWNMLAGIAFFALARRIMSERWAWVSTLGLAIFLPYPLLSSGGNTPELYLVLPVIIAYLCLMTVIQKHQSKGSHVREYIRMAIAGMALMLAALFKPPELAHFAVIITAYVFSNYRNKSNGFIQRTILGLISLTAGALLVLVPVIIYLSRNGALQEFIWQAIVYNSYYVQSRSILLSISYFRAFLSLVWPHLLILFILGVVTVVISAVNRAHRRYDDFLILGWLIVELVCFGIGRRFFVYHFIPLMPALVLLSTLSLKMICQVFQKPARRDIPLVVLKYYIIISLLGLGVLPVISQVSGIISTTRSLISGTVFNPVSANAEQMALVQEIDNRTQPEDPIFIWGAHAGTYFLSERPPASRFLYIFPLLNSFGGLWEGYPAFPQLYDAAPLIADLMTDLNNQPPRLILIEPRFYDYLDRVPEFKTYLFENYSLATVMNDWKIFTENHE